MELKIDIPFGDLMQVIKNLPEDQLSTLKSAISAVSIQKSDNTENFRNLLLRGPVMTDDQYKTYKENRTSFNKWRSK